MTKALDPGDAGRVGPDDAVAATGSSCLKSALEAALPSPFVRGNSVTVLRNGDEIFPAMLEAIERAQRRIDFETFVYWGGAIAHRFAGALADAANRGVRVRVLLDAVGSMPMPHRVRRVLDESAAEVRDFHPPFRFRFWKADHRTHRKILVCDDEGFTGGVGIAEEWTGHAQSPDEWRDSHFRIHGPAVKMLRASVLGHWLETAGPSPDVKVLAEQSDPKDSGSPRPPGMPTHDVEIQVVPSNGGQTWPAFRTLIRVLLAGANRRIRIATAYFVPEPQIVELLCDAARRGVDVEVLHPGPHTDQRICQLGAEAVYSDLLEAGVKIFRYQPTMFHTKVITVDGILATIGSVNLNHRSMMRDDEIALNVHDREFTAILDAHFVEDLICSERVDDPADWSGRSIGHRAGQWFARLIQGEL
jgi:cardiolipin synthase